MLPVIQILMDLSTTVLAILIGILAYRKLPVFYRILFFQALAYLLIDCYAATYRNNEQAFNLEITIEISLVFLASSIYFKTKTSRLIISGLFLIFLLLFIFDIYSFPNRVANHAYIIAGIFITGIYLAILFYHFLGKKDNYHTSALVLTCLGTAIYFACMVPYMSMLYKLQDENAKSNQELFQLIVITLGHVRYFLVALAFLIHWKPAQFHLQNKSR